MRQSHDGVIPPTTRPALYCDRVIDDRSCKQVGPGLRYTAELNRDAALRAYDALRHRMASRRNRYIDCKAPDGQGNLIFMDHLTYEAWDQNAQAARKAYLAGEITAEDFLRRIDLYHDLEDYDVAAPKERGKSVWRRQVEHDIRFDPYQEYIPLMTLDLNAEDSQWVITTSEDRIRAARGDKRSLRDLQANLEAADGNKLGILEIDEEDEAAKILRDAVQGYLHGHY